MPAVCMLGALATGCVAPAATAPDERSAARAGAQSPDRLAQAAYLRGLELSLAKRHAEAIEAFYEAVQHDPLRGDAHYRAGLCYYALGEYERERVEYRKALAVAPQAAKVWRALGESCQSVDDLQGARHAFEQAASLEPRPLTLFNLAMIEVDLGNVARARELYERCIQVSLDARLTEEARSRLQQISAPEQDG